MSDPQGSLHTVFNDAVRRFWCTADRYEACRSEDDIRAQLLDDADTVLFARDAIAQNGAAPDENNIARDVADMVHYLHKNEMFLNAEAQQTSTGRKTYRVLNKPRF